MAAHGGRSLDELSDDNVAVLGRLLARLAAQSREPASPEPSPERPRTGAQYMVAEASTQPDHPTDPESQP